MVKIPILKRAKSVFQPDRDFRLSDYIPRHELPEKRDAINEQREDLEILVNGIVNGNLKIKAKYELGYKKND